MRFHTAAAALAIAATAFASNIAVAEPAEPPITNPNEVVTQVTEESLITLLRELGAQKIETRDVSNGRKQIVFYDGTMPYNMMLTGCDIRPGKCIAYALVALLETGTTNYTLDAVNTANKSNAFVTMVRVEANKIGGGRIQLVDGGVTKKNIAINIASFILNFAEAMKGIQSQLIASYRPGNGFQKAAFGQPQLRGVQATPEQMLTVVNGLATGPLTTLRR
ncbi:MAG: hypothetical protein ACKVRO_14565 [Micropepsaceae bacterium]